MPKPSTLIWQDKPVLQVLCTLLLGACGAGLATLLGLPLPILVGSMLVVASFAILMPLYGRRPPALPSHWRRLLIPILGVAIGATIPPDFLTQAQRWWPTVLAILIFIPAAHAISFWVYRRFGAVDKVTAYFAAMPGGFVEAIEMGEAHKAETPMLAMLQFLRLILCIILVPLSFAFLTGHSVGSGAGVSIPGSELDLTWRDGLLLLAAAVGGALLGKALRLPAPALIGPLFLSGLMHATGMTAQAPPGWMISGAQLVIGTTLGAQFAGMEVRRLFLAVRLSLLAIAGSLALALALALPLSRLVDEPLPALILAFAPGGVSEMALVAISLQMSAIFVTLHHLVRIVFTVFFARIGLRFILAPKTE